MNDTASSSAAAKVLISAARLVMYWRAIHVMRRVAVLYAVRLLLPEVLADAVILAYFKFPQTLYAKHGEPTSEQRCLKQALRPVRQLSGSAPTTEFGPRSHRNVCQFVIDASRAHKSINTVTRSDRYFLGLARGLRQNLREL